MGLDIVKTMDIMHTVAPVVSCSPRRGVKTTDPTAMEVVWVSETDEKTLYFPTPERPALLQGALSARLEVHWFGPYGRVLEFEFYPMLDGKPIVAHTMQDMHGISRYWSKLVYSIGAKYTHNWDTGHAASLPSWKKHTGHVLTKVVLTPGGGRSVRSHWV